MPVTDITALLHLIGSPPRLRALDAMSESRHYSAEELLAVMDVEYSNGTKHLARLIKAGVLTSQKEGRQRFYAVQEPLVFTLIELAVQITQRRKTCH